MRDNIKLAFHSIWGNKARSMLTMLGIIIGIAAVIAIMTIGEAMNAAVKKSNDLLGYNNLSVSLQAQTAQDTDQLSVPDATPENQKNETPDEALLTPDLLAGLEQALGGDIKGLSYSVAAGESSVQLAHTASTVSLYGANTGFPLVNDMSGPIEVVAGHWLQPAEQEGGRKVAVVAESFAQSNFGTAQAALGQQFDCTLKDPVTTVTFTIVGVYRHQTVEAAGGDFGSFGNFDLDAILGRSTAYAPVTTVLDILGRSGTEKLNIAGAQGVDVDALADKVDSYFSKNYHRADYSVSVDRPEAAGSGSDLVQQLSYVFSAVAAISLLVGGIGVMNIMIVSITERTREIGVRMALGARASAIRRQFIIESIIICFLGGVLGIILGLIGGNVAARFMGYAVTASWLSIVIAFGVSTAIGVFFGFYPANKAAKMDPIEALRYE